MQFRSIRFYLWEEKENLSILHCHLFSPLATCARVLAEVCNIHEAVPGGWKAAMSLTLGLPPGVKSGASWMATGCTLVQEPAPGLASVPVDLVIVPCCHTAQILSKPNASVSQETFKIMVK